MRRTPFAANIIISNLPEDFSGSALAALFDDFGLVLGATISRSGSGALRGMVNLAPPKAVEAAITALDGQVVEQRHLRVRRAPERPVRARTKLGSRPSAASVSAPAHASVARREAAVASSADRAAFAPVPPRPARTVIVERRPLSRLRAQPKPSAAD